MMTAESLKAYFEQRLADLPVQARLVLVLDPPGLLALGADVEVAGRRWAVFRYDGNDLAFRKAYGHSGPAAPHLIWVTRAPRSTSPTIDLSYLTDVLRRADDVLDLSLAGVLKALRPHELWPQEALSRFEPLLADRLGAVLDAHVELRRVIGPNVPLDTHCIRALVLHALHPTCPVSELTFRDAEPRQILARYLRLSMQAEWEGEELALLQEQARLAPGSFADPVAPWLEAPAEGLALYLYLRRLLTRRRVANIAAIVHGLLPFDPRPLEPWIDVALRLWDDDSAWRDALVARAERALDETELDEALALLGADTLPALLAALSDVETPAVAYGLGRWLLAGVMDAGELGRLALGWPRRRPLLAAWPQTPYSQRARDLAAFLDELAFLFDRLTLDAEPPPGLAGLVDWYVKERLYDLEYAGARADEALRRLPALLDHLRPLLDQVRATARRRLDELDRELARRVREDWDGYLSHPRLALNVLRDAIVKPRLPVSRDRCVWIVVFDGMRYDSWERAVKPRLLERYSLENEQPYLSLLPSWTGIARTGLLAGKPPAGWHGYRGSVTLDQEMLAARLFGLSEAERKRQLRFYSGMESDRTQRQLDRRERFPYNILVFNVSDDNLHAIRGDLTALNATVDSLLTGILETLDGLVQPEDTLVVTSDHGFVELETEQAVVIRDDARWQRFAEGGAHPVHYRFLRGVERPAELPVDEAVTFEYPDLRDGRFTVAVGRRWFAREGATRPDHYTHGGLSLAEMVVPGAVLRPVAGPLVKLTLEGLPRVLTVPEEQEASVEFALVNGGNRPARLGLEVRVNTAREPLRQEGEVRPGQRFPVSYRFTPVYADAPGQVGTERLEVRVEYVDAEGKRRSISRTVVVTVEPRKDLVKFSLGGLDALDDL